MLKLLRRLAGKDVDEFARTLARDVAKRYPPELDNQPQKRISANRITRVLEDAYDRAVQYNKTEHLGLYRKARLGNSFRWELKDLGYSQVFIDTATEGLIVYITRRQEKPADGGSTS